MNKEQKCGTDSPSRRQEFEEALLLVEEREAEALAEFHAARQGITEPVGAMEKAY